MPPTKDPNMTRRFLELLTASGPAGEATDPAPRPVHEFAAFGAFVRRGYIVRNTARHSSTVAGWYDDIDKLKCDAMSLDGVSGYVGVNPCDRALLARSDNAARCVRNRTLAKDITCLRWLFLDIDSPRPTDISATQGELDGALELRDRILADHPEMARAALWGSSGNGGWVLIRLADFPNDSAGRACMANALNLLANRYGRKGSGGFTVDTQTKDPCRVMPLPGTLKCKGSNMSDRPWRLVTLDGIGEGLGKGD